MPVPTLNLNHYKFALLAIATCLDSTARAQTLTRAAEIEEVTIIGSAAGAKRMTGSAHYIGPEALAKYSYADIQRIIREIPGVSVQVEDGFGLRPNLSIRGVASERSSRITLLEDNVLIAPAPYAAPAAYYFPTAGRLHAVEVVKGASAITQGPYTTGGAINMVSTPVPASFAGQLLLEAGQDESRRLHGWVGGYNSDGFGALLETHLWNSDGFQTIDASAKDTGLAIEDYTLKLAFAPVGSAHKAELKLQSTSQDSNQSYLGLTDADFRQAPYRRYGLSALDNIATEHTQAIARYSFQFAQQGRFTSAVYRNDHTRQWFKTEGIDLDGSPSVAAQSRRSWSTVINAVNNATALDGYTPEELAAIVNGISDTPAGSIGMRANNREYYSQGVQAGLELGFHTGVATHQFEAGIRYHEDAEDRLQFDVSYQQLDGVLVQNAVGELGAAGNQVQQANALSVFVHDTISLGKWDLTPGLRVEDIDQQRIRYSNGIARNLRDKRNNNVRVWLPGLGVAYQGTADLRLIAGVHKGFSAPSNVPGERAEEAINYEFGFRYDNNEQRLEVVGFVSDYKNLVGVCTASSGVDCQVGDVFNGDAATVQGVEVLAGTSLQLQHGYSMPLLLTYTLTDSRFDTDIADTAFFGNVKAGDQLPYLPESQWRLSAGIENPRWDLNMSLNYVAGVCATGSCGPAERTDASLITDLVGNFHLSPSTTLYGRIDNLADTRDIMGRQPYGARPNRARTAMVGLRMVF